MADANELMREMYRLGLLLTGDAAGARAALLRVLSAADNPLKLGEARRLRLLMNGAREWWGESRGGEGVASGGSSALLRTMEALPRAAWVLLDVEGVDAAQASRMLGVTRQSVERYAEQARLAARAALGTNYPSAVDALRDAASQANASAGLAMLQADIRRLKARRRRIAALQIAAALACMAIIAWVGKDLMRAADREKDVKSLQQQLSLPMSEADLEAKKLKELERTKDRAP